MTETKKVNPLLRAWAAGVFDARCTIPKSGAVLRFESVDAGLMKRFEDIVGVGKTFLDSTKRTVNPVTVYVTTSMDDARELLLFVSPLLSPRQMKNASDMLGRIERNPHWIKNNPEKAALSVTARARSAAEGKEPPSTAQDGATASVAD